MTTQKSFAQDDNKEIWRGSLRITIKKSERFAQDEK
jgi:hypothetical protein